MLATGVQPFVFRFYALCYGYEIPVNEIPYGKNEKCRETRCYDFIHFILLRPWVTAALPPAIHPFAERIAGRDRHREALQPAARD